MFKYLALMTLTWAILAGAPAQAALFRIEATSVVPAYTDFVVEFDDLDGDNLYSTNEQTFFSGVTLIHPTFTIFFDELRRFEPTDGISDDVGTGILFFVVEDGSPAGTNAPVSAFSFELSAVGDDGPVSTVPLPAAAWMYIAGILGLGFLRRVRKRLGQTV